MAAYELHKHVNRNSDGIGSNAPGYGNMLNEGDPAAGGGGPLTQYLNWGLYDQVATCLWRNGFLHHGAQFCHVLLRQCDAGVPGDIGDEAAFHVGGQYVFDFGLTVNAIFERMTRKIPDALEFQNERQRNGYLAGIYPGARCKGQLEPGLGACRKNAGRPCRPA